MHALRVEREGINVAAGRNATTYRGIKQVRLCLARVGVAQCGRQAHPDQTKTVKRQDRKTLATTGAIKRLLPCPVEGIENRARFQNERKKQIKSQKKKDKKENRKKRKEKTEKNGSYFKEGMHP